MSQLCCHEVCVDITAEMCAALVVFLSTAVLHSVSAGGEYCAKTAQARAAALGLPYPGVHGAPDLSGPAPIMAYPKTFNDKLAASDPNVAVDQQILPGGTPFDEAMYKQAHPRSSDGFQLSRGIRPLFPDDYTADQMPILPGGPSAGNPESSFKEVKRIALPTLEEAPGRSDLVNLEPLSLAGNKHDPAVDESAPDGYGMSLRGVPLPRSGGRAGFHSGLTADRLEGGAPVARPLYLKGNSKAKKRGSVYGGWRMIRFPSFLTRRLQKGPHVIPFVEGKAVWNLLRKSK